MNTNWKTQMAINIIDKKFEEEIQKQLNLFKIVAPLVVNANSGLNDDLSGVEKPVSFKYHDDLIEIVQSTAKWKRYALHRFGLKPYTGIYVEMNAIRKDEAFLSKYHSLHVDQYDWEMVIQYQDRNINFLKKIVNLIWNILKKIKSHLLTIPNLELKNDLHDQVTFISSEALLKLYPKLKADEREKAFAKKHQVIFIYQIGELLSNGLKHGERAPDYDDWKLNGDLIVWDQLNQDAMELSSMGIRVDHIALLEQLHKTNSSYKTAFVFHQNIINKKLPLTIGGGIGKSRINMFLLEKPHVKFVQPSYDAFTDS